LIGAGQSIETNPYYPAGFPSLLAFSALTAILITAYLLNQVFDQESDKRNNKCLYLAHGLFRARTLVLFAIFSYLTALLTFHQVDNIQKSPLFIAAVLSLAYSLPPLRLCARPFLDLLANAIGYGGVAFVLGHELYAASPGNAARLAMPYVFLVAATFLHTAILDIEGDRLTGKITTAVFIGENASRRLAAILHGAAVAAAIFSGGITPLVITGATAPLSILALARKTRRASMLLVQGNTLVVALAAVALWPAFTIIIAPLIFLSRYYHAQRFGIIYPGPPRGV
jgi:4-hydroxybenzoate polyprenyltransferase